MRYAIRHSNIGLVLVPEPTQHGDLRLGSQGLIRLAGYINDNGRTVTRFELVDNLFDPAPHIPTMIQIITTYGSSELEGAMWDEYAGLYIVAAHFRGGLSISRWGIIETDSPVPLTHLIRRAHMALHLS